jgi:hypothetical protein
VDVIEVATDIERVHGKVGIVILGQFGGRSIVNEARAFGDKRQLWDMEGRREYGSSVVVGGG